MRFAFTIDGAPIDIADWSASSRVNRGHDSFRGTIRAEDLQPLRIVQGSVLTAYLESGRVMWQGRIPTNPALFSDQVDIAASGHAVQLDKRADRLLFQLRDIGKWSDEASAPFLGTPSATINAEATDGVLIFDIPQGTTVAQNAAHAVVLWVPTILPIRIAWTNTAIPAGYAIRLAKATGPSGSRTTVADFTTTGAKDQAITSPEDMVVISLVRTDVAHTTAAAARVHLTLVRVNALTAGDSLIASEAVSIVAEQAQMDDVAVQAAGANVLPLDWESGSWSNLLDYLAVLADARWLVLEDRGSGPVVDFGLYARQWNVELAKDANPRLVPLELFNRVVVRYLNEAGKPLTAVANASPDPLQFEGIVNTFETRLSDRQSNSALADALAAQLVSRLSVPRVRGTLEVVAARSPSGTGTAWDIRPGDVVRVSDFGLHESSTQRISAVDYSANGVSLSIEDHVSVDELLARLA